MTEQPIYLKLEGKECNPVFDLGEKIYHRIPQRKDDPNPGNFFSYMRTEAFNEGVSVNREKYLKTPLDVLWLIGENEQGECIYSFKENSIIIYCKIDDLKHPGNNTGVTVSCIYDPTKCNYSHCNLKFEPALNSQSKGLSVNLRLFLSTLFKVFE